jgi:hypothetical protein
VPLADLVFVKHAVIEGDPRRSGIGGLDYLQKSGACRSTIRSQPAHSVEPS